MLSTHQVPPPLHPTTAKVLPPAVAADLERLSAQPSAQLSAMRAFVAGPDTLSWTVDTLQHILKDHDHLAEIANQSFAHPNGFDSIPLENSHPSHRVRLHVWWPEASLVTEDVHNHAWNFASHVLTGALTFKTYRKSDAGVPHFHYPWRIGEKGTYDSNVVATVKLDMVLDACFTENTYYTFDLDELHRVAPVKTPRPVSTLVIIGKMQRNGSDVYTEQARHGAGYRLLKDPYSPHQLADRLRRYLECL
jgi:hypothetical protein